MRSARRERRGLDTFLGSLGNLPALPVEEERKFAIEYRETGSPLAAHKLILHNLPFVVKVAAQYHSQEQPLEDLIQEGTLGLIQAVRHFDPDRNCRLITYAGWWIRASIRRYLWLNRGPVRGGEPGRMAEAAAQTQNQTVKLSTRHLEVASDASEDGAGARGSGNGIGTSLWAGAQAIPIDTVVDPCPGPEDQAARAEQMRKLQDALSKGYRELKARERWVLTQRWMSTRPPSFRALGETLSVSHERVRQIERNALRKIRAGLDAPTPFEATL